MRAINFGAATKVVFRVIDDCGHPVSNALVKAGFYLNGKAGNSVNDYTGLDGLLVAERKSVGEINYWINKPDTTRHPGGSTLSATAWRVAAGSPTA